MPSELTFYVPTKLISEANQREHWAIKTKRKKAQQRAVELYWLSQRFRVAPPVVVTLTRVGVRKLDPDNLAGSFKHVQDAIAVAIIQTEQICGGNRKTENLLCLPDVRHSEVIIIICGIRPWLLPCQSCLRKGLIHWFGGRLELPYRDSRVVVCRWTC